MDGPYSPSRRRANDISTLKLRLLIPLSLLTGAYLALPVGLDRTASARSVGAALVGDPTGWDGRLAALLVPLGGWALADAARLILAAAPWAISTFVLLYLVGKWRAWAAWLVWIAIVAIGVPSAVQTFSERARDHRLSLPSDLVATLQGHDEAVFVNASGRALVAAEMPGVKLPLNLTETLALAADPSRWRARHRSTPFSAVLLTGNLSDAKPLLRHLLESPDWQLARLDNQGMVFLRGTKTDATILAIPALASETDRAIFLAQYALVLESANLQTQATKRMEEAMSLNDRSYDVLFRAASLAASQKRWEKCRALAEAASAARPGGYEADSLRALATLESGANDSAFEVTSRLVRSHPNDPATLLLHARTSRAAKQFQAETDTLERLLDLAQNDPAQAARIHIYLAQSWAQRGFSAQATDHYQAALQTGKLSAPEQHEVTEALDVIRKKTLPQ